MNFSFLASKLLYICVPIAAILFVYFGTQKAIRSNRKDAQSKATNKEKGLIFIRTLCAWGGVGGLVGYQLDKHRYEYMVIGILLCIVPAASSLIAYFEKNDKLSSKERFLEKRRIDREEGHPTNETYGNDFL